MATKSSNLISFLAIFLFVFPFASAVSPGSYFIVNVAFSRRVFTGLQKGVELSEGYTVTTGIGPESDSDAPISNEIVSRPKIIYLRYN